MRVKFQVVRVHVLWEHGLQAEQFTVDVCGGVLVCYLGIHCLYEAVHRSPVTLRGTIVVAFVVLQWWGNVLMSFGVFSLVPGWFSIESLLFDRLCLPFWAPIHDEFWRRDVRASLCDSRLWCQILS